MSSKRRGIGIGVALFCFVWGCDSDGGDSASPEGTGGIPGPSRPACSPSGGEGAGPYADLFAGLGRLDRIPVRGRLVNEDGAVNNNDATPFNQFSQDEIGNATVEVAVITSECVRIELGSLTTGPEGYLEGVFEDVDVPAGIHRLEVSHQERVAGTSSIRVLANDYTGLLIRSDVDQTWLDTRFMGTADKLELLGKPASERRTLPAMNMVYPAIKTGLDGQTDRSLVFLSGSPRFFKRVLEAKLVRDGVHADGLVLKPFKDIIIDNLLAFDLDEISAELHEQIGYKVYNLLRLRLDVPPTARELLMGDDTEADVVAYALYHRFTAGMLDGDALVAALGEVDVAEPWLGEIQQLAPTVATHLAAHPAPVQTIYINRTDGLTGEHFPVGEWSIPGITRYHTGAWPLVLDLYEDERVSENDVRSVRMALQAAGHDASRLDAAASAGVDDGFLDPMTAATFADAQ